MDGGTLKLSAVISRSKLITPWLPFREKCRHHRRFSERQVWSLKMTARAQTLTVTVWTRLRKVARRRGPLAASSKQQRRRPRRTICTARTRMGIHYQASKHVGHAIKYVLSASFFTHTNLVRMISARLVIKLAQSRILDGGREVMRQQSPGIGPCS